MGFSELSICAACSSFLLTSSEPTPFAPHALQSIFNKLRVSFQSHLVLLHIDLGRSIQDLQLLRVFCGETRLPSLFHLEPFLQDVPKDLQLLPSCNHAEVVTVTQSFEISVLPQKNARHAVSTFMEPSFNTTDSVSRQIDNYISCYMLR